jgi:hypothetical protein
MPEPGVVKHVVQEDAVPRMTAQTPIVMSLRTLSPLRFPAVYGCDAAGKFWQPRIGLATTNAGLPRSRDGGGRDAPRATCTPLPAGNGNRSSIRSLKRVPFAHRADTISGRRLRSRRPPDVPDQINRRLGVGSLDRIAANIDQRVGDRQGHDRTNGAMLVLRPYTDCRAYIVRDVQPKPVCVLHSSLLWTFEGRRRPEPPRSACRAVRWCASQRVAALTTGQSPHRPSRATARSYHDLYGHSSDDSTARRRLIQSDVAALLSITTSAINKLQLTPPATHDYLCIMSMKSIPLRYRLTPSYRDRLLAYADSERWSIALATQVIIEEFLDARDTARAPLERPAPTLQPAAVLPPAPVESRRPGKRLIFGSPKTADLVYSAIEDALAEHGMDIADGQRTVTADKLLADFEVKRRTLSRK